jgi:hypothetical protein
MKKINLKLIEIIKLEAELNGVRNNQTGEILTPGLLQEKMSLVTKYWLTDLAKKMTAEKNSLEELKNELIIKYGKKDEKGNVSILMVIEEEVEENGKKVLQKKINPVYQQFEKELSELLETEKEIEYKELNIEDFSKVETSENYSTFFKLLSV